jgi:hypothetical protein
MPFEVMRVTIQGTALGGESWSINPVYSFGDFDQPTPTQEAMAAAAQAVADVTPGTNLRNILSTALTLTGARLEARMMSGGLAAIGEATRTVPIAGATGPSKPYQTSLVFSLRTALPGGRGRGRLYWPALGATMTSTSLRWEATQQTNVTDEMAQYLEAIGIAMETPLGHANSGLVVWSRASAARAVVTSISSGDVFDTQRRRRDRAVESYVSEVYPPV